MDATPPLVSVVIPTHNRPEHLSLAVSSVAAQTYRPLEILVIDDDSEVPVNDSPPEVPSDVSLRIVRQSPGKGAAGARNRGAREAKGEYIAFLDDDDSWFPDKLEKQIGLLTAAADPRVRGSGCQMLVVDENGTRIKETRFPSLRRDIIDGMVYRDENVNPSTLVIHKAAFDEVGEFNESLPTAEDRQWLLRYLFLFDLVMLDQVQVRYLEHSAERLSTNFELMLAGERQFLQFIRNFAADLGARPRKAMGYRYAKLGNELLLANRWSDGILAFFRGIVQNPLEHRAWAGLLLSIAGPGFYRRMLANRMQRIRLQSPH